MRTTPMLPATQWIMQFPGPEWVGRGLSGLLEEHPAGPVSLDDSSYIVQFPGPDWIGSILPQDCFTPSQPELPPVDLRRYFQGLVRQAWVPADLPRPTVPRAPHQAPRPATPQAPALAGTPQTGYRPEQAVDFALSLKGRRSDSLHEASRTFWNPTGFHRPGTNLNDNNCANFVSGVLRTSGGLSKHQTGVKQLEEQLVKDGWTPVPEGQSPRPGDVWVCHDRQHVELVAQVDSQGQVKTVGSNNRTGDGESGQWVSVRTKPQGKGFYMTPPARG